MWLSPLLRLRKHGPNGTWSLIRINKGAQRTFCYDAKKGVIKDVQTRADITRRLGIGDGMVGSLDRIDQEIQGMRDVKYRVSGPPGQETLERDVHFRLVIEKPLRFAAEVTPQGIVLTRIPTDSSRQLRADKAVKQNLTEKNIVKIDAIFAQWTEETFQELKAVSADWNVRVFPITEDTWRAVRLQRTGLVVHEDSIPLCGEQHNLRVEARWQNPFPELGQ